MSFILKNWLFLRKCAPQAKQLFRPSLISCSNQQTCVRSIIWRGNVFLYRDIHSLSLLRVFFDPMPRWVREAPCYGFYATSLTQKRNLFHPCQNPWFDEKWPANAKHQMALSSYAPSERPCLSHRQAQELACIRRLDCL